MIARHTFKKLIESIMKIERGISKIEDALEIHIDQNWLLDSEQIMIRAIAEGFYDDVDANETQIDTIEELLYHVFFMEDFGNDSEHCKNKLIIVDEGKDTQHSISCTNIDELYNAICIYVENITTDFTFNYCHSYHLDEEVK